MLSSSLYIGMTRETDGRRMGGGILGLPRRINHMRVRITGVDGPRAKLTEADAAERRLHFGAGLVDEALADAHLQERVGEPLLEPRPLHLPAMAGVHVFEDERAAWAEALENASIELGA